MTKKLRYPIEVFALAAVLFSSGMKEAMIVGIGLIFGDILQYVLGEFFEKQYTQTIRAIGVAVTGGVIYLMCILTGMTPELKQVIEMVVICLLLVKHQDTMTSVNKKNEIDYNGILLADTCAYGFYVLLAIVREYLTNAAIFGFEMPEVSVVSASFGKPMFALIGAGIMIALINLVLRSNATPDAALWVAIPAIILEVPFVWNQGPEWLGMMIGILVVGVIYLTLRKKLIFSETEKHIEGVSVELVMLGIIYMIFSIL